VPGVHGILVNGTQEMRFRKKVDF